MCWNKGVRRFISLKSRLAFTYGLLFFVSCAVIFFLMGYLITKTLNNAGDAAVRRIASEIKRIYVMGSRFDQLGEILPGADYPINEKETLRHAWPGVRILYVYRTTLPDPSRHSNSVYNTAYAYFHGEYYEFRVLKDGQIYSKKISVANHATRLRRYFSQTVQARGQDNFSIALLNPNGSEYLSSPAAPERKKEPGKDTPPGTAFSGPHHSDFRFMTFSLPDGKILRIGRNIRTQIQLRNQYTFLFFCILSAVTLLGIAVAWLISRRFIRGVNRMTLAMTHISSGDYSYRIPDVTDGDREIRELMETFNAMNDRTEELMKEIKMMSDDVAHDLRTPLTRISGTVELLLCDRNLNEGVRTACVSVAEETARMKELVNTIMDISRTNSRPEELRKTEVNLTDLLRDFCELMQPAIEEKGLELQMDIPDDPIRILADKTKFQRVLSNLLENALKFTEHGFIRVSAFKGGGQVFIRIQDTGCGIPEEDREHVFERFFQGDASRHLQGNGLGLALVQAIVRAHGWRIELTSSTGKGTSFTIRIPEL